MIGVLTEFWDWSPTAAEATTGPKPKPRPAPVFIGDIVLSRGGEPELLRRWREDQDRKDQS